MVESWRNGQTTWGRCRNSWRQDRSKERGFTAAVTHQQPEALPGQTGEPATQKQRSKPTPRHLAGTSNQNQHYRNRSNRRLAPILLYQLSYAAANRQRRQGSNLRPGR